MLVIRNPRARRYLLRLNPDGSARVTIPRGGSLAEARKFAQGNVAWFEHKLQKLATHPNRPAPWMLGMEILFRGELVKIEASEDGVETSVRFGTELIKVKDPAADLRSEIGLHLWRMAAQEFPSRVLELAASNQLKVHRITVRNQKSRWGSCSRTGTISLNWRLIQAPPFARDYLILHELMHLRQMNHSDRYWREVQKVCPYYLEAEYWLKKNSAALK